MSVPSPTIQLAGYESVIELIKLSDINRQQFRPYDAERAKRIADNFDLNLFETPTVNVRPDGSLWMVEGMHRIGARKLLGHTTVMARIIMVSPEEEARIALDIDRQRKRWTSYHRLLARADAGDPTAIGLIATTRASGLELAPVGRHAGSDRITAVESAERVYRYGPELYADTLRIIQESWDDSFSRSRVPILGIGGLLKADEVENRVKKARLITILRGIPSRRLQSIVEQISAVAVGSSGVPLHSARALRHLYNKGLRQKLPPIITRRPGIPAYGQQPDMEE